MDLEREITAELTKSELPCVLKIRLSATKLESIENPGNYLQGKGKLRSNKRVFGKCIDRL
jgi:hypothetical protein